MEKEKAKGVIESILFATGRVVKIGELITILELNSKELNNIIVEMQEDYKNASRGIEIVRVEDGIQLGSKKEYYEYLYPALDKRIKPTLSQASLETLAIIAYNPRATRADIESIRGVDSTASLYRLQEYDLIEQAGKADLPGKPMTYKVTTEFLKMFGLNSLKDLPDLPKYKFDSNRQIVIDDVVDDVAEKETESLKKEIEDTNVNNEAPSPETVEEDNK